MKQNDLEVLTSSLKFLPLLIILIISFGYLDVYFYYSNFSILIHNYLDASEIIFLFSPILFLIVLILIIHLYLPLTLLGYFKKHNTKLLHIAERHSILFFSIGILILSILFFIAFYWGQEINNDLTKNPEYMESQFFEFILYCMLTCWVLVSITLLTKINFRFIIPLIILSFIWFLTKSNANKARRLPTYDVSLTLIDKNIISTNDSIYFIGETRNYIFLRNMNSKFNSIISKQDVTNIQQRKVIQK